MFAYLHQCAFSADTFAHRPADPVVVDDKGKPPLLVPLFILVMHYKFTMSPNTNPNPQLQVLFLYVSKPMNQTPQFEESPFNCKIQKWFKLSP